MTHRRPLTPGEIALSRSVFGDAIDYASARVANRKWIFFQPKRVTMAPLGCIHFHPAGGNYRDDFADAHLGLQGHFIHEMTHIWQHQRGIFLPLRRHPFCRYDYALKPGWTLDRYGIEQQAEIVRHIFLLGRGAVIPGAPPIAHYRSILPFTPG
ncbi:vgr related protein [Sphingomonas suaedae]|uniref:Vgr related protein n=1 Tax=Sphingomonas suaedae TaxID=2599297 RepID=A0A518RE49_9SPHN|nr:vgr related protein [Sphingomonas suaedae]QDX25706.1 vgr related protein [Sphingomonas suaedae]